VAKRKSESTRPDQQQPYDNLLKSLLEGQEQIMLPYILPGAEYQATLNIEVIRNPLRVDRVYLVIYKGEPHILHIEFESGSDNAMATRLLDYHAYLYHKHGKPVISIIVYPFSTKTAISPHKETSGGKDILVFHFHVLRLWEQHAEEYLRKHAVVMYALLPTMDGANAQLLNQAIDEMIAYYHDDDVKLGRELRWLGILLRRATIVPSEDKKVIEQRLSMYDDLFEKDPKMQKILAEREVRGEEKGATKVLRKMIISYVAKHFPALTKLARQRVMQITQSSTLDTLLDDLFATSDEATARKLLESLTA